MDLQSDYVGRISSIDRFDYSASSFHAPSPLSSILRFYRQSRHKAEVRMKKRLGQSSLLCQAFLDLMLISNTISHVKLLFGTKHPTAHPIQSVQRRSEQAHTYDLASHKALHLYPLSNLAELLAYE